MKKCIRCNEKKQLTDFPKHIHFEDGLDNRCRVCIKKASDIRKEIRKTAPPKPDVCQCCGKKPKKHFCLDHCHKTNTFRGWICDRCNMGIGQLGDNASGVSKALIYLIKSKFKRK